MDLKISGTVTQLLPEQSGESQNGPWKKQDFILETQGQYPKSVCITQWGEKIEEFGVREGEELTVHIDIQSREYKGRWYTDVKAWRVERESASSEAPDEPGPFLDPSDADRGGGSTLDDDLPF